MIRWLALSTVVFGMSPSLGAQEAQSPPTVSDFIRYTESADDSKLETAIGKYRSPSGASVDLVGVVHIGDRKYYEELNQRFKAYDAVLYELVGKSIAERRALSDQDADAAAQRIIQAATGRKDAPSPAPTGEPTSTADSAALKAEAEHRIADIEKYLDNTTPKSSAAPTPDAPPPPDDNRLRWLGSLQENLRATLELESQLQVIDYDAPNFVHADMSMDHFFASQEQKKESFLGLWWKATKAQLFADSSASGPGLGKVLEILCSKNGAPELKRLLASQFDTVEQMMAGIEADGGSAIIGERNRYALEVLDRELKAGKRNVAVFYGAAHLPDMEARLFSLGYKRKGIEWLTAWSLPPPPAPASPASVPPRQILER